MGSSAFTTPHPLGFLGKNNHSDSASGEPEMGKAEDLSRGDIVRVDCVKDARLNGRKAQVGDIHTDVCHPISGRVNTFVECRFGGDIGSRMVRIDYLEPAELAVDEMVMVHGLRNATDLNGNTARIAELLPSTGRAICKSIGGNLTLQRSLPLVNISPFAEHKLYRFMYEVAKESTAILGKPADDNLVLQCGLGNMDNVRSLLAKGIDINECANIA